MNTSGTLNVILFVALSVMSVLYLGEKYDNEVCLEQSAMLYNQLTPIQKRRVQELFDEKRDLDELKHQDSEDQF